MGEEVEIFKDIKGYEERYQVSNLGRVKSLNYNHTLKSKNLKCAKDSNGYDIVSLCKLNKITTHSVHRLVALHFIHNPENKRTVNHIDGNKSNNYVNNLEWCTYSENIKHAFDNGLKVVKKGTESHMYGKTGKEAYNSKKVINIKTEEIFESAKLAAESIGIKRKTLNQMLSGKRRNKTDFKYLL